MKWHELSQRRKQKIWLAKFDELLKGLTPYERDCMWKVNFQGADGEAIDPHAERVVQAAIDRFNHRWVRERESQEYGRAIGDELRIVARL